jgi:transposase
MHVVYERCCGIDVHKKFIVACLCVLTMQGTIQKEIRSFSTMTVDLLRLLDWLKAAGCTHVAMESTADYWKPIFNLLETDLEVWLINAQHIKAVPGRKTDVKDAEWIADLLQHGLLKPSFIPPRPQRELRDLTRYRTRLVEERARLVNRIQKGLEDANIKLAAVVTDITGVSARAILNALVEGQTDVHLMAELARGKLKAKRAQLEEALVGTFTEHHRFFLKHQLSHLDLLDEQIAVFNQEIAHRVSAQSQQTILEETGEQTLTEPMSKEEFTQQRRDEQEQVEDELSRPDVSVRCLSAGSMAAAAQEAGQPVSKRVLAYVQAIAVCDAVTGINERIAQIIVAEIGVDMSRFVDDAHLASWVGLVPGANISAGKRLSGKIKKGNRWLRQALIEAAHGAARSRGTYLGGLYGRLCRRLGSKKAIVALAHRILIIIYHLLKEQEPYYERGEAVLQQREHDAMKQQAVKRLQKLGYKVSLEEAEVA